MSDYLPFATSVDDCRLIHRFYSDPVCVRVGLHVANDVVNHLGDVPIWLDPCFDAYPYARPDSTWAQFVSQFEGHDVLTDQKLTDRVSTRKLPDASAAALRDLTNRALDACLAYAPDWVSVPQLPQTDGNERNRANRELAKATREWGEANAECSLILPLIFTNQRQVTTKTAWQKKVRTARRNYELSGAAGLWIVDSSLDDHRGTSTNEARRFPALIDLHQCIREQFADARVVAGPYWGMNLVLWARGLIDNPAVGVGRGYQYYCTGGFISRAMPRLALPPLRRQAMADDELPGWLDKCLATLQSTDPAYAELMALRRDYDLLRLEPRDQMAGFYKRWYQSIAEVPRRGRALALYEDLSSAFVLGKMLATPLPSETGHAKKPEIPAKQLMLFCL